ncbi:13434_t:CDS:2, partial [Cetraspora pellucida]
MNKKSAMNEESLKKRHRFPLEDNEKFISEAEDTRMQAATTITTITNISNSQILMVTITQQSRTEKNNGHYEAACSYYEKIWVREKLTQLEVHLTNECAGCPDDISRYWHEKDDQIRVSSENSLDSVVFNHSTTLLIEDIVDLTVENNSEHLTKMAQTISSADLDYNPLDVLHDFLE